jgi:hypothetical protein
LGGRNRGDIGLNKLVITHEERMRNIAGGVELERRVPGLVSRPQREFWYFEDRGERSTDELFDRLVRFVDPPLMKHGGAILEGCELTTPAGSRFRCLSYKGDLENWRRQVIEGAAGLGIALGQLVSEALVLRDGRSFALADCGVKFD